MHACTVSIWVHLCVYFTANAQHFVAVSPQWCGGWLWSYMHDVLTCGANKKPSAPNTTPPTTKPAKKFESPLLLSLAALQYIGGGTQGTHHTPICLIRSSARSVLQAADESQYTANHCLKRLTL
eukprot:scaffold214100_cov18-Tisochrysis_lutea.AAC.1